METGKVKKKRKMSMVHHQVKFNGSEKRRTFFPFTLISTKKHPCPFRRKKTLERGKRKKYKTSDEWCKSKKHMAHSKVQVNGSKEVERVTFYK